MKKHSPDALTFPHVILARSLNIHVHYVDVLIHDIVKQMMQHINYIIVKEEMTCRLDVNTKIKCGQQN